MLALSQIKISYPSLLEAASQDRDAKTRSQFERSFLKNKVAKKLRIDPDEMHRFEIVKRSIDARNKPDIMFIYAVHFEVPDEETVLKNNDRNKDLRHIDRPVLYENRLTQIPKDRRETVVIVGCGPAGLFAAYALTLRGLKPIVIDRGASMDERIRDVESFWESGALNNESNVSFGEGGAGTFSDGKLNSGVKDREGSRRFILETFVFFGADREILYDAKPHIGTDVLRRVIVKMRQAMEKQGAVFLFNTKMQTLILEKCDGLSTGKECHVRSAEVKRTIDGTVSVDRIACDKVILAIGHSARDTFMALNRIGVELSAKPFAVGVRIQHRQSDIDRNQYGLTETQTPTEEDEDSGLKNNPGTILPAANYKLTGKTSDGRGVYSFCMCPGGYVVNASSEEGGLVVNGMSDAARNSGYANSAIVVTVDPDHINEAGMNSPGDDSFGDGKTPGEMIAGLLEETWEEWRIDTDASKKKFIGMAYQRVLEKLMYRVADGEIPVQRFGEFKSGQHLDSLSKNQPAVKGRMRYADVRSGLPDDIAEAVIEAVDQFGKKIHGFDAWDALVLGMESRTSSPVRIVRDEMLQSVSVAGLYPCGEGAGYAGGILSAAMDGLRVAAQICHEIMNEL